MAKELFCCGGGWNGVTRFVVPCFLLISGAFLLSNDKNAEWGNFYKKSFRKLGIPLLLISIVYVLYYYARNIWYLYSKTYEKISWTEPLLNWLKGILGKHLWYMYMLVVLYLLVPWLIRMKKELSNRQWDKLGLLLILGGGYQI